MTEGAGPERMLEIIDEHGPVTAEQVAWLLRKSPGTEVTPAMVRDWATAAWREGKISVNLTAGEPGRGLVRDERIAYSAVIPVPVRRQSPGCPFCERVLAGEFGYSDQWSVAFEPLGPVVPGHFLVVPRRHVASALESPAHAAHAAGFAARLAGQMGLRSFNLITSSGAAATQTVPHLHWHIVPRSEGDGLALPWTGQHRADPPHGEEHLVRGENGEPLPGSCQCSRGEPHDEVAPGVGAYGGAAHCRECDPGPGGCPGVTADDVRTALGAPG